MATGETEEAGEAEEVRKPVHWLVDPFQSPPWSEAGRIEAGNLPRSIQEGNPLGMPHSRPMPSISPRCHELRVRDEEHNWRIVYRIDPTAILVVGWFPKKTQATPKPVIRECQARLKTFDEQVAQERRQQRRERRKRQE